MKLKNQVGKNPFFLVTPILSFPNLIFQLLLIVSFLSLDQLTCSLPKNVTTFHGQQDGIIHFYLSPNKRGVLALWIYILTKKIMDVSKLDFSTSSYHNSTNNGLIDMFFTKKCNYFSWPTRWNHSFLSQPPLKGCFGTLKSSGGFIWHRLYFEDTKTDRRPKPLMYTVHMYCTNKNN